MTFSMYNGRSIETIIIFSIDVEIFTSRSSEPLSHGRSLTRFKLSALSINLIMRMTVGPS